MVVIAAVNLKVNKAVTLKWMCLRWVLAGSLTHLLGSDKLTFKHKEAHNRAPTLHNTRTGLEVVCSSTIRAFIRELARRL